MIALENLQERLIADEGEVLHAYPDSLGFLTIGVGHLIDSRKGGKISQAVSRFILSEDIQDAIGLARTYPWFEKLDSARQGVIVCMLFQMGKSGFDTFRMMQLAIERGDYTTAAAQMRASAWHTQTPARCERLAKVMETGEWI
jgi:lysozyme